MRLTGLALVMALSVGSTEAALACQGTEVLFEDSFETMDPTWGTADDAFFIEDGQLTIMPGYDEYYSALNTMGTYEDIDLCFNLKTIKADPEGNSFAGLIFWAIDYDNYYYVVITAEQSIGVFRRQRGRVLPQLRWATFDALEARERRGQRAPGGDGGQRGHDLRQRHGIRHDQGPAPVRRAADRRARHLAAERPRGMGFRRRQDHRARSAAHPVAGIRAAGWQQDCTSGRPAIWRVGEGLPRIGP